MAVTAALPRVTYSNIATDFTPVHDHLDRLIPEVRATLLGRFVGASAGAGGRA